MIFFKLIRRIIAAVLLVIIVVPLYAIGATWSAAKNTLTRQADVIVVLGAAQLNGRPGEVLEARLVEAKRVFDAGLAPQIITVGAKAPGDRTTEAASRKSLA
jgi:vancomycin permeability regulator SanA